MLAIGNEVENEIPSLATSRIGHRLVVVGYLVDPPLPRHVAVGVAVSRSRLKKIGAARGGIGDVSTT